MRRVWNKFNQNRRSNFSPELRLKTNFLVRTRFCFAHPILFCTDINEYLMTSKFSLKVSEAGAGKQFMRILCYREPPWASRRSEVVYQMAAGSKYKCLFKISTHFVNYCN